MKVRFTAEIIDDDGNVLGKCTSEGEGVPSIEELDLSTKEEFSKNFDALEKVILKARNQIGVAITSELLNYALKNTCFKAEKEKVK